MSGGERLKLDLLMVLALQPELLLDEPDNHLDHASGQLLIQVLADYPGGLIGTPTFLPTFLTALWLCS